MTRPTVAVLTPPPPSHGGARVLPSALPLGRLAAALDDIDLLFVSAPAIDGAVRGATVRDGAWVERVLPVAELAAVYDRFPSRRHAGLHAAIVGSLGSAPRGNGSATMALCRDKWQSGRRIAGYGASIPPALLVDERCPRVPANWRDGAYLKPRFGSFGVGVTWMPAGAALPREVTSLDGVVEPALVQRAVPPPDAALEGERIQAIALRVLVQRTPSGELFVNPAVARVSTTTRVTCVRGGARAYPLEDFMAIVDAPIPDTCSGVREMAAHAAESIAEPALEQAPEHFVEVGVDLVFDRSWRPWVIEVNGKPAGHLGALARQHPGRFEAAHLASYERPIRTLLAIRKSASGAT